MPVKPSPPNGGGSKHTCHPQKFSLAPLDISPYYSL